MARLRSSILPVLALFSANACGVTSPNAVGTPCQAGHVRVAAACVDLRSDPANCGTVGNACPAGQRCASGACQWECPEPHVACGTGAAAYCANTSTDASNCGACGNACPAGQRCVSGACQSECGEPYVACGTGAAAYCANTSTDASSCGACGNACPAGQRCVSGACQLECPEPQVPCGTGAAAHCATTSTDASNCGACGNACPLGEVCSAGACSYACAADVVRCGEGADSFCADLSTDPANCGACGRTCPAGQRCAAGACELVCASPLAACGTGAAAFCADTRADRGNCGACGHACRPDAACTAGRCVAECAEPRLACGGACVDPRSDGAHCGACGVVCPDGRSCRDGFCAAPACGGLHGFPGAPAHGIIGPVALGDVDGDGVLDIAGGDWGGLGVALGKGDGTFRPPVFTRLLHEASPVATAFADLDGDGLDEVVASTCRAHTVSVIRVLAGGALGERVDYAVPDCPRAVVATDVDGDGHPDLAVVTYNSRMAVFRNAGDGTFLAPVYYQVGSLAEALAVADLDGDGYPDLATASQDSGEVGVLWNDGAGGFKPQVTWAIGGEIEGIAAGDVDRDGAMDLVVAGKKITGAIRVLRNLGGRAFEILAGPKAGGQSVFGIALADLDDDGWLDLLAADVYGSGLDVLRGGAGGFAAPERWSGCEASIGVAVGDLDGDGRPDVAVGSNQYTGSVFLGRAERPVELRGIGEVKAWTAADLDGDGNADLALADRAGRGVTILLGDGRGGFAPAAVVPVPFAPIEILAADLDGDGRLDLALVDSDWSNTRESGVAFLRNLGGLTFAAAPTTAVCKSPRNAVVRDLDGDGRLDLAVACPEFHGPSSVGVLIQRDDGFAVARYPVASGGGAYGAGAFAVGDLDGDGAPDLVMGGWDSSGLTVLTNRGDGTFETGMVVASCALAWDTAVADLDGDGVLDVVQACAAANSTVPGVLAVSRGLGAGAFATPTEVRAGVNPLTVTVRDLDGDGIPDLVATDTLDDTITVARGSGGGAFLPPVAYAVGRTLGAPLAVDIDGDGRRDLVVHAVENSDSAEKLVVLPQRCIP